MRRKAKWIYWDGWKGNSGRRIDDATCSNCGYKHPTVTVYKNPNESHTPNLLFNYCPMCGFKMIKE